MRKPSRAAKKKVGQAQSFMRALEAADRFGFDGWWYLPALTPTLQMTSMSRRVVAEKTDWLCNNVGAVSMVIDGLALDEVGSGFWPKWDTENPEFNKELTDAYHYANHDPRIFSADHQNDAYSAQFAIRRTIRRYGDGFGQLLRPLPGRIMPSMSLLPGYIVDNPARDAKDSGFIDGVKCDDFGAPLKYMVLDSEKATTGTPVDALDLLHFHDPFLPGQRRGLSCVAPVIQRLWRREGIHQMISDGTLAREMVGYAVETQAGASGGPKFIPPGAVVDEEKQEDGTKLTVVRFGDKRLQVPTLPAGQTIKTVETNRPATAVMEFLDAILREVAWATLYPPEYVFYLAGMGQGTAVRLVLSKVRNVLQSRREFQLKPQFLNRWHVFWAWQYIKSGRVKAKIPENWWKHKVIPVPDISVDIGREGRLYDSRVSELKMPIEEYYGLGGWDREDADESNLRVMRDRMQKLRQLNKDEGTEFTYFDLWPRSQNAQLSLSTVGSTAPDTSATE